MFLTQLFSDPVGFLTSMLIMLPGLVLALSLHEFAHGYAAYRLGDPTAKLEGRLTLNPFRHMDVFGLLMLLFVGFGWAKPVSINSRNFKHPKRDIAITALAGPIMNFILSFGLLLLKKIVDVIAGSAGLYTYFNGSYYGEQSTIVTVVVIISQILYYAAILSLGLGIFNLIPIPPLDGWKVLGALLPAKAYFSIMKYERYGFLLMMVLLLTNVLTTPLAVARSAVMSGFDWVINAAFGLFGL